MSEEDPVVVLPALLELSTSNLDMFVTILRARLPYGIRAALPPYQASSRRQLEADLKALLALPESNRAIWQPIWLDLARSELGAGEIGRLHDRLAVRDAPDRDFSLGAGFVPEKTKIDLRDDMVDIDWLARAQAASASVAHIEVPRFFGGARAHATGGTAFLVAPQYVITAYHVIEARDRNKEPPPTLADLELQWRSARVSFDYEKSPASVVRDAPLGAPPATTPDVSRGAAQAVDALAAYDATLDFALLRLSAPLAASPVTFWRGGLPAIDKDLGFAVNIIQHPQQRPKQLALRNNAVWRVEPQRLYYFTDTRGGSSGAPVFNDAWKVLAVHTGFDWFDNASYMGRRLGFSNRGTRVAAILDYLQQRGLGQDWFIEG